MRACHRPAAAPGLSRLDLDPPRTATASTFRGLTRMN